MQFVLLKIRFKQIKRHVQSLGVYSLLLFPVFLFLIYAAFHEIENELFGKFKQHAQVVIAASI